MLGYRGSVMNWGGLSEEKAFLSEICMSCGWWWKDLEDGTKQIEEQVPRPIKMNWYVTTKYISVPGKGYERKWGKSGKRSQGRQDWCRHMNVVVREKIRKASEVMGYPDMLKIGEWHCMRHIWARWLLFRGKFVFFYITINFLFIWTYYL